MNKKERGVVISVLVGVLILVIFDLTTDSQKGAEWWHLCFEGTIAFVAALGILLLVRTSFSLKNSLALEKRRSHEWRAESEKWKPQSKKYLKGLSEAIDHQMTLWGLTHAEREVAFLLLKGLSYKEIAEIRKTSERTTRAQSISVYAKSNLNGRSELAAFFLEDLLVPPSHEPIDKTQNITM